MKPRPYTRRLLQALLALSILLSGQMTASAKPSGQKTVYLTYILHGNMNYDRYVRPVIWQEFPVIYDGFLDFMDEHPEFKGQLQLSGQTLESLKQAASQVLEHARLIHKRGQLNFTGTFYSEPVNVNMDGETNFRCAWLGTRIVEDFLGERTDGFYLQERAYHPQLPWILNHAGVSWTPVIVGEEAWRPFLLRGMDSSQSVCVPVTKGNILDAIRVAPDGALITVEEDYEIPQSFAHKYDDVTAFCNAHPEVRVEWITVKEYLERFGAGPLRYVDHAAKAGDMDSGTYSRWTADPLDIILQDATNQAMADLRAAKMLCALARTVYGVRLDVPFSEGGVELAHDPLTWDIERADLYPDIEPKFLSRDGEVTLLSKAEHLLLWAVNSDAKGWYPLYEKRRERLNSLQNSSLICRTLIGRALGCIGEGIRAGGYDRYWLAANLESARTAAADTPEGYAVYDAASGHPVNPQACQLPSYGYMLLGGRRLRNPAPVVAWQDGNSISDGTLSLTVQQDGTVRVNSGQCSFTLGFDPFQIRPLAEVTAGKGDDEWRDAVPYGPVRCRARTVDGRPQLCVESQPDWLVHLQQVYTLADGAVECELRYVFPHPALVRRVGLNGHSTTFDPRGLDLVIQTDAIGKTVYDIPFGISEFSRDSTGHFCALSSLAVQYRHGGGLLVSPRTGEQAFTTDAPDGKVTVYLGASTTSGPIRRVGLDIVSKTEVKHEKAWYSEPFHGEYVHKITLRPFSGTWQNAGVPAAIRAIQAPVYTCEVHPSGHAPVKDSWLQLDSPNVEVTMMDCMADSLQIRFNERIGEPVTLGWSLMTCPGRQGRLSVRSAALHDDTTAIGAFGIETVTCRLDRTTP